MSWAGGAAANARLPTYHSNESTLHHGQQHQPQHHVPLPSFAAPSNPSSASSVPSYLQRPAGPSRAHNGWQAAAPARPQPVPAPHFAGGAPVSSYISSPAAPDCTSVPAQASRPSYPTAPGSPYTSAASNPSATRWSNQPTAAHVTLPHYPPAAPVAPAPRRVPLPIPHAASSAERPSGNFLPAAPPAPLGSALSFSSSSVSPSTASSAHSAAPPNPSRPFASLPGFGRPAKPAWLNSSRTSSPTRADGGSRSPPPPPPQRAIGPPPGVSPGPWWQQYRVEQAANKEAHKRKRRDDSRTRRQLLASSRVSRQVQQQPAFLDAQFTRYVEQSMEPTEEERRRLRDDGGGWRQRCVERYAHMQCMADRVNEIEHSAHSERLVGWMQRLVEEVRQSQSQSTSAGHAAGGERSGEKRKASKKLDRASSAKKARRQAIPAHAEAASITAGNSSDDDNILLRPLHSVPAQPQPATPLVEQKCATPVTPSSAVRPSRRSEPVDRTVAHGVLDLSDDEDRPVLLASSQAPSNSILPSNTASLLSTSVLAPSLVVDFPDFPSYDADDVDTSTFVTAQLQQLVLLPEAKEDVYVLSIEQRLSPPRTTRVRPELAAPSAATAPLSTAASTPVQQPSPPESQRPFPPATSAAVQPPQSRLPPPVPAQPHPPTLVSVVPPPRPLPSAHRPLPDPRLFMPTAPPSAPPTAAQPVPQASPPRPLPALSATSIATAAAAGPRSPATAVTPNAVPPSPPSATPPAASPGGAVAVVDRDLRRELAAAKREQWLREHGGPSAATADRACSPPPAQQAGPAVAREPLNRARSRAADVIDLASSSEDESVPLPLSAPRSVFPLPPPAPPVTPVVAASALVVPQPVAARSVGVSADGGQQAVAAADAAATRAAAEPSSAKLRQPFAAFRAPHVMKDKQRAQRKAEQCVPDAFDGIALSEKGNVRSNLYSQLQLSQISQS